MALLEDRTAVFIVRVWCERGDGDAAVTEWRGSVEHIESGQRVFFRHLDAVLEFIRPHLEGIGIDAQQRFWERISSTLDDAPPNAPVAIPVPSASAAAARGPSIPSPAALQARSPS